MKQLCEWGRTGTGENNMPCTKQAEVRLTDSGIAYCQKHYDMVMDNREWIFWKYGKEAQGAK